MIEEALRDPITVGMLKIDGKRLIEVTCGTPGPKVGYTLHALLEEVLEDPTKNTTEYLEKRSIKLYNMKEGELQKLGEQGKQTKEEADQLEINQIRKDHRVK